VIDLVELKSDFGLKYKTKTEVKKTEVLPSKDQACFNVAAKATRRIFMTLKELSKGILSNFHHVQNYL